MPQHLVFGKTGKLGARANDKFIHALFFESEFTNHLILDFKRSRAIKTTGGKGELTCYYCTKNIRDEKCELDIEGYPLSGDVECRHFCFDTGSELKENEDV